MTQYQSYGVWGGFLGLPDKTRTDEDDARSHLDPGEVATGGTVKAAEDTTELRKEVVAALHRIADLAYPLAVFTSLGCLHAEARPLRPRLGRLVAVGPIGLRPWQGPRVGLLDRDVRQGGLPHHRLEHRLRLTPIVGVGLGDDHAQGHGACVARYVQSCPTLGAINWRRPCLFTPFFDGFLEPSRRI